MEAWIQQFAILNHMKGRSHVRLFEIEDYLEYFLNKKMRLSAEEAERSAVLGFHQTNLPCLRGEFI
jgi:hypothetical protein